MVRISSPGEFVLFLQTKIILVLLILIFLQIPSFRNILRTHYTQVIFNLFLLLLQPFHGVGWRLHFSCERAGGEGSRMRGGAAGGVRVPQCRWTPNSQLSQFLSDSEDRAPREELSTHTSTCSPFQQRWGGRAALCWLHNRRWVFTSRDSPRLEAKTAAPRSRLRGCTPDQQHQIKPGTRSCLLMKQKWVFSNPFHPLWMVKEGVDL